MVAYKLRVIHDQHDKIKFSSMIQNINAYLREENKCVDDSNSTFQITGLWVTLPFLRIYTLAAITYLKLYTQYYPFSTLLVKTIGPNKETQKLTQISPFKKWIKGSIIMQFWRLMMIKEELTYL